MATLIDGYNLLYALGILHGRVKPAALERARLRLLMLLQSAYGAEASDVTVVFDAAQAPPGAKEEQWYKGIRVRFAVGKDTADERIEELVDEAAAPRQLTVVSDDHQVQKAAKRRGCVALGCLDFLESLQRRRAQAAPGAVPPPAKPDGVAPDEADFWMQEFADIENSPEWQELAGPDFASD